MRHCVDTKSGNKLSILGFGCMRFPRNIGVTDMAKTERLILKAIEKGVNYFDCAYVYPGSEETLGTILQKNNLREKVYIATKLPFLRCKSYEDFEKYFQIQLNRLKTTYVDYYLIHNLSEVQLWKTLCDLGIEKWIAEKKASGQIRQIGFSFHGKHNEFMELLDVYDWEFCQIQYNYVNINYQAGRAGLMKAAEKKLPVIIMEPLLGGKLATGLPDKAKKLFSNLNNKFTPAAWALRWLWNQPQVTVVLSGMNADSQLDENLKIADGSTPNMLSEKELAVFDSVLAEFNASYKVPCTGCNYCMPCPNSVNIPACFSAYNISHAMNWFSAIPGYITSIGSFAKDKNYSPSACVKCGKCEKHCPQHIKIMSELENVQSRMENIPFKIAKRIMRIIQR